MQSDDCERVREREHEIKYMATKHRNAMSGNRICFVRVPSAFQCCCEFFVYENEMEKALIFELQHRFWWGEFFINFRKTQAQCKCTTQTLQFSLFLLQFFSRNYPIN